MIRFVRHTYTSLFNYLIYSFDSGFHIHCVHDHLLLFRLFKNCSKPSELTTIDRHGYKAGDISWKALLCVDRKKLRVEKSIIFKIF